MSFACRDAGKDNGTVWWDFVEPAAVINNGHFSPFHTQLPPKFSQSQGQLSFYEPREVLERHFLYHLNPAGGGRRGGSLSGSRRDDDRSSQRCFSSGVGRWGAAGFLKHRPSPHSHCQPCLTRTFFFSNACESSSIIGAEAKQTIAPQINHCLFNAAQRRRGCEVSRWRGGVLANMSNVHTVGCFFCFLSFFFYFGNM